MDIIKNKITLIIALIGLIGGIIWTLQTNFNIEPIILVCVSLAEVAGYYLLPEPKTPGLTQTKNKNEQNVNVSVNVGATPIQNIEPEKLIEKNNIDRNTIIDLTQSKTSILFIDDDKNFSVVKILKDSNWKKVKTVVDIKSLDIPIVKEANIVFVDINGVGKLLNLEYEGLDLALMLKQRYPEKKVIIYSANRNSNSFHSAWDLCDFKLEKNALPYQFQNLVEEYSIELFKSKE
ncbi:MAG: hypothetical protein H7296_06305 [Bacteroidia bacterium]|nr:hypothetical protein [Bacteroidia bacterium]